LSVRSWTLPVCVLVLSLVFSLALVGCGSDTGRARSNINSGDNRLISVKAQDARLSTGINSLLDSVSRAIKAGKKPDAATFQKNAEAVKKDAEAVKSAEQKAASDYRDASKLNGAGDYAKYAALKLESSELTLKGIDILEKYLTDGAAIVKAQPFNAEQFLQTSDSAGKSLQEIGTKVDSLQKQAESLRASEKL
jgi:hypothetical protein